MMKRVGFCGFKQLDVKMPFCLGFGGVDTNGRGGDKCDPADPLEFATHQVQRSPRNESFAKKPDKGNLLNVLRRKWRRTKRFKCRKKSESLINMCHSYPENYEPIHCTGSKYNRFKVHKSKSSVGPSSNQVLESQSYNELDFVASESAHDIDCKSERNLNSSSLRCSNQKGCGKTLAKIVRLKGRASRSLSDLSCTTDVSSPSSKADSENDICQINCNSKNAVESNSSYSNRLCIDSTENVNLPASEDIFIQHNQKLGNLTQELYKLSKYGWYWGPINRSEAESKLIDQPDGAFLVRDSSDDRYILSLSFRSYGKTLHTRIEHSNGLFTFYSQPEPESEGLTSIVELITQSMCYSQSGVFCYSRSRSPGSPSFPVRLTKPISRFTHVRSLQYLCRFVIRQYTRFDHIQELPLPSRIKGYLEEGHY